MNIYKTNYKPDHKFVNFSEDYEIRYALKVNGFRRTASNIETLKKSAIRIKSFYKKSPSENLEWDNLHHYLSTVGRFVLGLEREE